MFELNSRDFDSVNRSLRMSEKSQLATPGLVKILRPALLKVRGGKFVDSRYSYPQGYILDCAIRSLDRPQRSRERDESKIGLPKPDYTDVYREDSRKTLFRQM